MGTVDAEAKAKRSKDSLVFRRHGPVFRSFTPVKASAGTPGRGYPLSRQYATTITSNMFAKLRISLSAADWMATLIWGSTRTLTTSDLLVAKAALL